MFHLTEDKQTLQPSTMQMTPINCNIIAQSLPLKQSKAAFNGFWLSCKTECASISSESTYESNGRYLHCFFPVISLIYYYTKSVKCLSRDILKHASVVMGTVVFYQECCSFFRNSHTVLLTSINPLDKTL